MVLSAQRRGGGVESWRWEMDWRWKIARVRSTTEKGVMRAVEEWLGGDTFEEEWFSESEAND